VQRALHTDASVLLPREVLRMHTLGSAEVLGVVDRVGSLVVDHPAPGPGLVWDVYATYVMACGQRNLKHVYVVDRMASSDGRCASPLGADVDGAPHEWIGRSARQAGMLPVPGPDERAPDAGP
jgi:5-methylthioadenosine/S-adenosylhomocysteine deaminase